MSRRRIALTPPRRTLTFPRRSSLCPAAGATRSDPATLDVQGLLLFLPVLLFSVVAHEYAHGYAALKQGDTTARDLGRLTWNPVRHVDPFMTVILPAMLYLTAGVMLGGAKPVPVDPRNYRNYRRGDIIVSLAGVFANLLVAFLFLGLLAVFGLVGRGMAAAEPSMAILQAMMILGIQVNMVLIAFNLLPIPPLDGSHVVKHFLPLRLAIAYQQVGRFGILVLIGLLMFYREGLTAWLMPALRAGTALIGLVIEFVLPGTAAWLRR
jgi:Zn-dependent protease